MGTVTIGGALAGWRVAVATAMRVRGLPILPLLLDPARLLLLPCIAVLSDALGVKLLLLTRPMLLLLEGVIEVILALVLDGVVVNMLGGARKVRRRLQWRLSQCAESPALVMVLVLSAVVRIRLVPLPMVLLQLLRLLMVPLPMLLLQPLRRSCCCHSPLLKISW